MAITLRKDPVVRDMRYFKLEVFQAVENLGTDWLSRLPLSMDATVLLTTVQDEEC